jgi:hypothetical protein
MNKELSINKKDPKTVRKRNYIHQEEKSYLSGKI